MKRFPVLILIVFIVLSMNSCSHKESVDLIVNNGKIYTVDDNFSTAESFAVVNGKIVAIGTSKEIASKYHSENIVDAMDRFIYPGFNDAHCHFNGYGINLLQYADLRGTTSPDEIYGILKNHYEKFGGDWVLGRSWDQNDWDVKEFPDKNGLDKIFPDIPVYLVRVDGHAGWCNSKALEIAGVTVDSKVQGGQVLVKNGETTGILIDRAEGLVMQYIPEVASEQQEKGLLAAQQNCFAVGLTSVTDCGVSKETVLLMDKLQNVGSLKMRINFFNRKISAVWKPTMLV